MIWLVMKLCGVNLQNKQKTKSSLHQDREMNQLFVTFSIANAPPVI